MHENGKPWKISVDLIKAAKSDSLVRIATEFYALGIYQLKIKLAGWNFHLENIIWKNLVYLHYLALIRN